MAGELDAALAKVWLSSLNMLTLHCFLQATLDLDIFHI